MALGPVRPIGPIGPLMFALRSTWASTPIEPNLSINDSAWSAPGYWQTEKCWVAAKNDAKFLYLALDVVADTGNDASTNDYFWLTFDTDENKAITPSVDVQYGPYPGNPNKLGLQKYLGPSTWTGLSVPPESEVRVEFGASAKSATPHRIWKFKIALTEINASLAPSLPFTYFGFRVSSSNPAFTADAPANFFANFAGLYRLNFATRPAAPVADLGPVIGTVGLIPTTKIRANGKATTDAGYYVPVTNAAFGGVLNLIANRVTLTALVTTSAANKYQVLHAEPGSAVFTPLVSAWTNYRWNGSDYVVEAFAANAANQYTLTALGAEYSIDDLLVQFSTYGMTPGLHQFKLQFFRADGTTPVASTPQVLSLFIDNSLPVVKVDSIKHGATEVTACAIETIGAAPDGVTFRITAGDPEGNLLSYNFYATYGENLSVGIHSQTYAGAVPVVPAPPAIPADWSGVTNFLVPTTPSPWRPPTTCAYSFVVSAYARTTNGYGYIGYSSYFRNLTLLLG